MKTLASRDNPRVRSLIQLAQSVRARQQTGRTILEGAHLAGEFLAAGGVPLEVAVASAALADREIAALLTRLPDARTFELPDAVFRRVSELGDGGGLLLVVDVPAAPPVARIEGDAVVLDRIQDPGNVGSILRSAAAAGIGTVFATRGCAQLWSPKVLRAGMGAHFRLGTHEGLELEELVGRATVPVRFTSSHADTSVYACDLRAPSVWVFGNEGQGLDVRWLEGGGALAIPLAPGVESLNVAAAAAVCLFEQARQRLFQATSNPILA